MIRPSVTRMAATAMIQVERGHRPAELPRRVRGIEVAALAAGLVAQALPDGLPGRAVGGPITRQPRPHPGERIPHLAPARVAGVTPAPLVSCTPESSPRTGRRGYPAGVSRRPPIPAEIDPARRE